MINPNLHWLLAAAKTDDLRREAANALRASEAQTGSTACLPVVGMYADRAVTLRPSRAEDRVELARLAALDGRESPSGPVLVAEVDGELRAALSLTDGAVVANPLDSAAALPALLREYSHQLAPRATVSTTEAC